MNKLTKLNSTFLKAFVSPSSVVRTDWALVLDDVSKSYPDQAIIVLK